MIAYDSAVAQLYQLGRELAHSPGQQFDLKLECLLLDALGHPEQRFPSVLVAGTNGKGSTAATLASILQAAGHRTALYTSPHLLRINERICVDGHAIGDAEFAEVYERVAGCARQLVDSGALPWHPNFFELITAMAFTFFAQSSVDVAVMEVGLGGRLDATNATEPVLSIIADISFDHQDFLGHTLREIAREKAGIVHPGGTLVTLPQHPEVDEVLAKRVAECDATLIDATLFLPPGAHDYAQPGAENGAGAAIFGLEAPTPLQAAYPVEVMGQQIQVDSPLAGRHQWRNLALAIAAAEQLCHHGVRLSPQHIEHGIRRTFWPGRFQVVPASPADGWPEIVLDVAHNPAGAWALRAALSQRYLDAGKSGSVNRPLTLVFGAMRDKPFAELAQILFPLAMHVVITRVANPRAATPEEIRASVGSIPTNIETEDEVAGALTRARRLAGTDGVLVITGSLYIVGEALASLPARVPRP
jgi:dihydrofolate synthase/folylpolyglutamate synthase